MTSQRSRFLASLGERLQSDLAAQEEKSEEATSVPWPEHADQPRADELPPEAIAHDRTAGTSARGAAQGEPEHEGGHEARAAGDAAWRSVGALRSEAEAAARPAVTWSETGMPLRLREAIASVRRVSHEMHEPDDEYPMFGRTASAEDPAHHDPQFEEAAAHQESFADNRSDRDAEPAYRQTPFGLPAPYEDAPGDELSALDADATSRHEQIWRGRDAEYREDAADDEQALPDEDLADDDEQASSGHYAAYEEPRPGQELRAHEEGGTYRHGWSPVADSAAYQGHTLGDEAAREDGWIDDEEEEREPARGDGQDPRERPQRAGSRRYGLHAAAFAVAIAFVALAGLGLGILSGGGDLGGPLARDTLRALSEPAPRSSAGDAPLADPERPSEPGELVTVRVAPAPVAAVPGPAPAAPVAHSALPLPPPPKPVLRQPAPTEAALPDRQITAASARDAPVAAAPGDRQITAASARDAPVAAAPGERQLAAAGTRDAPVAASSQESQITAAGTRDAPVAAASRERQIPAAGTREVAVGASSGERQIPAAGVPDAPVAATSRERQIPAAGVPDAPVAATSRERQLAAAVDDAGPGSPEAAGTGGPFEPLFAKLPATGAAPTRVFVHYSAGVVGAPATAMHLVRHLKAAGFAVEVRAIEFPIPTNSIRYFFDSDRAQAEALRARLEGQLPGDAAVTVMDFTSYQPRPRPGLIEIWLRA